MKASFARSIVLVFVAAIGAVVPASAVRQTGNEFNTLHAGLGAEGYDVVAYFTDGKPVAGSEQFAFEYGGVTWRFASAEHRDLFVKSPERYAPQYGGFCAWGVSVGKLFDVDPVGGWTLYDGRLYLNFNPEINATFAKDPAGFTEKANSNWTRLNR